MRIKLTEGKLKQIVAESVKRVLCEMHNTDMNEKSKGFLDCISHLNMEKGGNGGDQRIIDGKVYRFSLSEWSNAYSGLCLKKGDNITYQEFMDLINDKYLIGDASVEDSINSFNLYKTQQDNERQEKEHVMSLIRKYRASFENACDDLYYGYGYKFWFEHEMKAGVKMSEADAKLIWNAAREKMSE